eukprot:scaffold35577_cov56-Isochrysis_galbana.AAC.1
MDFVLRATGQGGEGRPSPGCRLEPSEALRAVRTTRRVGALAEPLYLGGADEVAARLEWHAEHAAHNLGAAIGGG